MQDNGTVCSAFWRHANLRGDDRIFPCCRFKTPVGNFNGDLINVLSSEEYKSLREQSLAGAPIAGCEKCYHEESLGKESLRQQFNKNYNTDSIELEYFEVGFDNICNLTCDGCFDEFSSAWARKNNPDVPLKKLITRTTDITAVPDTIKQILFLGGEPLMTTRHIKFLELVNNKDQVSVTYNTNGTFKLDTTTISLLNSFKKVNFIVSIDGYDTLNDVVRSGSKWNDVLKFIDQVNSLKFDMTVHTTIHKNNWSGLKELQEFICQKRLSWTTNVLTYPQHLDIMYLNPDDKFKLEQLLYNIDVPNKDYILNHIRKATDV
jgi:sulfatase maturation enzyme AslB (radical SAM superfamily)